MKSRKDCWQELIEGKTLVNTKHVTVKMLPDGSLDKNISFMHSEDWSVKEEEPELLQLFEGLDYLGVTSFYTEDGDVFRFDQCKVVIEANKYQELNIANRIPNGRTCFVNVKTGVIENWGEEK